MIRQSGNYLITSPDQDSPDQDSQDSSDTYLGRLPVQIQSRVAHRVLYEQENRFRMDTEIELAREHIADLVKIYGHAQEDLLKEPDNPKLEAKVVLAGKAMSEGIKSFSDMLNKISQIDLQLARTGNHNAANQVASKVLDIFDTVISTDENISKGLTEETKEAFKQSVTKLIEGHSGRGDGGVNTTVEGVSYSPADLVEAQVQKMDESVPMYDEIETDETY